jgi:hypothetical protein
MLDIVNAHATLTHPSTERPSQEQINATIPLIVAQQRQPRTKMPETTRAPAREAMAAKKQRQSARSKSSTLTLDASVDQKTKLRVDQCDDPIDCSVMKRTKDQDSGTTRAAATEAAAKEKRHQERTFDSVDVQAISTPPKIKRSSQGHPQCNNPINQN